MELPIAVESYRPSADALVRAIKRAEVAVARVAAQEAQFDWGTLFTQPDRPTIRSVNFASELNLAEGMDAGALLDAVDEHFAGAGCRCMKLSSSGGEWPAALAQAARQRGFEVEASSVQLLKDYVASPLSGSGREVQIIPGRAAYGQLRDLLEIRAGELHGDDADRDSAFVHEHAQACIDQLDEPRLDAFLGRINNQPAGVVMLFSLGQIGVIDRVFTATKHRRTGVATKLMAHAIEHCQRAQFEQVILEVQPENEPARLFYQKLGFTEAATFSSFIRS